MITWHPLALRWLEIVMRTALMAWGTAILVSAFAPLVTGDDRLSRQAGEWSERIMPVMRAAAVLWLAAILLGKPS